MGWAFGLGLERIAMVLFSVPDIRLFWSQDPRFLSQFSLGSITPFKPYSRHPPCYKDFSFWTATGFHENDFCEVVRDIAGDLVEGVQLVRSSVQTTTWSLLTGSHLPDRRVCAPENSAPERVLPAQLPVDGQVRAPASAMFGLI